MESATPLLTRIPGALFLFDLPHHLFLGPLKRTALTFFLTLYVLAKFWHSQVTRIVPAPYLDEVFHIPQAQAYCKAQYEVWDPKLTTPPGLYGFAVAFITTIRDEACSVERLRLFNVFALVFVMFYASDIRYLTTSSSPRQAIAELKAGIISTSTLHTALNVALFPPLFFFSGLFYTDILSTAVVLRMYTQFLRRGAGLWLYVTGIVALMMRQTNVFWVAVFMGGLEAVRSIKSTSSKRPSKEIEARPLPGRIMQYIRPWSRGAIHDIPLQYAGVHDYMLCALSIGVAIISKPVLVLTRLWPYIALLASFGGFVFWNGGVVLGDKSNHVATIHLPQLLYIWPFLTFFSFPLILPATLVHLQAMISSYTNPIPTTNPTKSAKQQSSKPQPRINYSLNAAYVFVSLVVTLLIVKYNTIIHPFTLADNRHYIFYIFRYSVLRHPLIRYALAPIYIICAYLVYLTLCPPPRTPTKTKKVQIETEAPTTSFVLILLATTALSLITAPLVEPRYFIIPWVVWRLHVPEAGDGKTYDRRLFLETLWFLIVNSATGYVFLYRGFEWVQEPGLIQRFMW